ncbi:Hypothetical predicted protein [Marmota monax]|uniref:Uncharacterized protein n=2 Tax=Marmota monax TaxID=9995 RepID=A0A5E4D9P5_MARMO|nr:Hypothetical predicted protein [Marmota monax]
MKKIVNSLYSPQLINGKYFFSLKMEPKTKGLKQQQQQHKKLLEAMLSQDSFESIHSPTPSVTEEVIDKEDDAMELLAVFGAISACTNAK